MSEAPAPIGALLEARDIHVSFAGRRGLLSGLTGRTEAVARAVDDR